MILRRLLILCLAFHSTVVLAKVSSDSSLFLPSRDNGQITSYQQAPISWWNFLFFNSDKMDRDKACEKLNALPPESLLFNPCSPLPLSTLWLDQWGLEKMLSSEPPGDKKTLEKSLDHTIVQLSLPIEAETLNFLRNNPLVDFKILASGFSDFYQSEPARGTWQILPFLVNFSPQETERTQTLFNHERNDLFFFAGPHIGLWKNQTQIQKDLKKVIVLGLILMTFLFLFFTLTRRTHFFLLIPILVVSIGLATFMVEWIWGSIHGLTLAFGSGLIGISMDYAFHGWKKKHDPILWRSNFLGFVTSLVAFLLLLFFSSPLIQQLALFAAVGLSGSFVFCFLISKFVHRDASPIHLKILSIPRTASLTMGMIFLSLAILSLFFLKTDFSLSRMDFAASEQPPAIQGSDFEKSKENLAFVGTPTNSPQELYALKNWSLENKISYLSPGTFETLGAGKYNFIEKWKDLTCQPDSFFNQLRKTPRYQKLFKTFFDKLDCQALRNLDRPENSALTQLFSNGDQTLSLLKPETETARIALKKIYPQTFILSDLTQTFPQMLKKEIYLYLVTISFLAFLLLSFVFRKYALLGLLPVLGGWCGIVIFQWVAGRDLTFISFISLLILFGLTLDYGIFSTTYILKRRNLDEVFGSIAISAGTSIAGFSPLALSQHPVLRDLGLTITFGLAGACLMTFLVYPHLHLKGKTVHV